MSQVDRPLVRIAAFGALGLYGVLRWATLAPGQGRDRLLALLGLALALCAVGPFVTRRSRVLAGLLALLAALVALAVAGIPVSWITHFRVAVTSQWIGNGMADVPGVLTPYFGSDHWVLIVMTLGAAVLLTVPAILMALTPARVGGLRRAAAALPLLALGAIPAALVHPKEPFLEGLLVFALLCAFLWGDQVPRGRVVAAVGVCAVAGLGAIILAPGLQANRPWLNYEGLANGNAAGAAESFDWSQRYGPITWPRTGRPVLQVTAAHADYWKAQDLDAFDGRGWTQGVIAGAQELPGPTPAAAATWTHTIGVKVREMTTPDVIGAGTVTALTNLPKPVVPGVSPGTWSAATPLTSGDSYRAKVYSPHPGAAQLQAAGSDYGDVPTGYRTLQLPFGSAPQVVFGGFHSGEAPLLISGSRLVDAQQLVAGSPYGGAFDLAQRLAAQADTPYDYVQSVMAWLHHGYTYNENPPARPYPLEAFLFVDRKGYCQQFAGAMALLLRMGGIPARVAVGFTPGTYDSSTHSWLVTDMNAHAWVEAWFPQYGWVRFDPTPGSDPALQNTAPAGAAPTTKTPPPPRPTGRRPQRAFQPKPSPQRSVPGGRRSASAGGTDVWVPLAIVVLFLAVGAAGLWVTRPLSGPDAAIAELDRAFARSGHPLPPDMTLAELEHRLQPSSPDAAMYVRRLRLNRYGGGGRMPSTSQRRALRQQLAAGRGPVGWLGALWALPPRRRTPLRGSESTPTPGFGPARGA